jgi:hypothetical protein
MKNTAVNTLKYTGIVTLSQYIGSKKIKIAQMHNTGKKSLFDYLADCLIGDFTKVGATRPTKIKLVNYIVSNDPNTYSDVSGFIYLLTKPEKIEDANSCRVRYSFIVPKDEIEGITFTNLGVGLYADGANDTSAVAAFCPINGLSASVLMNASLVIDWELVISDSTPVQVN